MGTDRGSEQAVAHEDDEGYQHEDGAEPRHMGERMGLLDADELRQEGEEEDQELGVQDVDQDRLDGDLARRAGAELWLLKTLSDARCV
jgi:hypothetical protein